MYRVAPDGIQLPIRYTVSTLVFFTSNSELLMASSSGSSWKCMFKLSVASHLSSSVFPKPPNVYFSKQQSFLNSYQVFLWSNRVQVQAENPLEVYGNTFPELISPAKECFLRIDKSRVFRVRMTLKDHVRDAIMNGYQSQSQKGPKTM